MTAALSLVRRGDHPDFLDLPWHLPLTAWDHPRLVKMARGIARHVVRFVAYGERVYALKETDLASARREYDALLAMAGEHLPTVEAVAVVSGRAGQGIDGEPLGAVLITRYLDYSLPYRYLYGREGGPELDRRLTDAAVVLLVRLHLERFYWGDCSLSNVLFRRDAGSLYAYLVDAETAERRPSLSDARREHDVELAMENVAGGLADLVAAGRATADPFVAAEMLGDRYRQLWAELTRTDEFGDHERHIIELRLRRLNELGFDVEELSIERPDPGDTDGEPRLRIRPTVVEEGHHSRELRRLTGLDVQENQARRLLNDITAFTAHLERETGAQPPWAVAAARWLADVYEPLVAGVPDELRGRLEPPELFHELLEHRYFLSEAAGHEVDNATALASYLESVLPYRPDERHVADPPTA